MLPYPWRLSVSITRTTLGITCVALALAVSSVPVSWALLPLVAYVAYSLFALRRAMETAGDPLLTLIVDTVAFLLWFVVTAWAGYRGSVWAWLVLAAYLFVVTCAVLNHAWPIVTPVVGVCLAALFALPPSLCWRFVEPMAVCTVLASVWFLNRRHLEGRLDRASSHNVVYRFEAQQAREDERQRIAADFHDGPLQSFISMQMRLEILRRLLQRDPVLAAAELVELQELCRSQVGELRAFVRSMRPADVTGSSLGASISRMVEQFQKDTGISASFLSTEGLDPNQAELSLELLQVVREALNNVRKHARASRVAVSLNRSGEFLEITVEDNGEGFPFAGTYTLEELDLLWLGPVSIRRRVKAFGGQLSLESRPGQGAELTVRVAMS